MAGLNDEGQWIILMGFIISIGIFFLAILINQSVLVGQTTAEAVLEFPKADIQDLRNEVWVMFTRYHNDAALPAVVTDIETISLARKNALVDITVNPSGSEGPWSIHYNNGITSYTEEISYDAINDYYYFHY